MRSDFLGLVQHVLSNHFVDYFLFYLILTLFLNSIK